MHLHHKCRFPFGNIISVPWVQWWKAGLAVLLNLQLDPGIPNSCSSLLSSPLPALTGSQWPPFLLTIPASRRMRPLAFTPDFMLSPTSAHQIKLTTSSWALLWVRLLFLSHHLVPSLPPDPREDIPPPPTLLVCFLCKLLFCHQSSLKLEASHQSWALHTQSPFFIFQG